MGRPVEDQQQVGCQQVPVLPDRRRQVWRTELLLGVDDDLEVVGRRRVEFVEQFHCHHELRHRALGIRSRAREYPPVRIETLVQRFPGNLLPVAGIIPFLEHGDERVRLRPGRRIDRLAVGLQIHEHGLARRLMAALRVQRRIPVGRDALRVKAALTEGALHPGHERLYVIRMKSVVRQSEKLAIQRSQRGRRCPLPHGAGRRATAARHVRRQQ